MTPGTSKKPAGSVVIIAERCKGCAFCVEFCPSHALHLSDQFNSKGYHPPALVSRELCNGCNICGLLCPDFAIYGFLYPSTRTRPAAGHTAEPEGAGGARQERSGDR